MEQLLPQGMLGQGATYETAVIACQRIIQVVMLLVATIATEIN